MREFDRVGVIGLGAMGAGIAEVFARAGFDVVGVEIDDDALEKGRRRLHSSLARALDKGRISAEEESAIRGRVSFSTDRTALANADFVVEAVPERMDIKRDVFTDLDRICARGTILATNTSSLSVTEIASLTSRPHNVVGLHFFNPAPVMKLVEVVGTVATDPGALDVAREVAKRLGKTPIVVSDRAGFVANALLVPYINHAISLYERRVASREEIDAAAVAAAEVPMGPLTLADMVGLEVCLAVMDVLWEEFRTPRFAAAPLLRRMVAAGMHGRKSGRGFYDYSAGATATAEPSPDSPLAALIEESPFALGDLMFAPHLNDALWMVTEGYASADDVDTAVRLGCGYPRGPIQLADEYGHDALLATLAAIHDAGLGSGSVPAPLLSSDTGDADDPE
ncbi:3-hydroxyacyl-CoA dehydrogenase [Spiractinospora alimapuensis]|uniref:3-hydroxyacyl-CoA dehydrogenase n=1 Tax=Spiractinospora alimapuensis TaxID=2820884 RepID=UPI001EEA26AD|nr:3-hydroxybutyryl-CoA dehydrogenase [Spiractinospora alimapuensis]QVQ54208.1 3-hydroxyacyl-CoA dehydrogenase [Spiractinospora alimapuensis]